MKHVKCYAHVEQFPKPHPSCHVLLLQYIKRVTEGPHCLFRTSHLLIRECFRLNSVLDVSAGLETRRRARLLGFDSRQGQEIFPLSTASTQALKSTQPPIEWVLLALSLEVKWQGREANHSRPSSAEVNPLYVFMAYSTRTLLHLCLYLLEPTEVIHLGYNSHHHSLL